MAYAVLLFAEGIIGFTRNLVGPKVPTFKEKEET